MMAARRYTFLAGAGSAVITPPLGLNLAGWNIRAAGHNRATHVHDDLHVKALVLQRGSVAWAVLSIDVGVIDAVATEHIRVGLAARTELAPEAVLVCATHCHSAPSLCPVAVAQSREDRNRVVVSRAGKAPPAPVSPVACTGSTALYAEDVDRSWRAAVLARAIEAGAAAWDSRRPVEMAYVETEVQGVASSRRVRLADGTWGDPRREPPATAPVVSRTEIDPMVRLLLVRERHGGAPLAALLNYGSHPWVFAGTGISAELAGAVCARLASAWRAPDAAPPVVLFLTGPEGDATLIWNIDLDGVWRLQPNEDPQAGLERREAGFRRELARLGGRLAEGVLGAIGAGPEWSIPRELAFRRREALLPLKPGYVPPPGIEVADWQRDAPAGHCRTEIQWLHVGPVALLGLPGEPFTAVGRAIRAQAGVPQLLIAALANDGSQVNYIADRAEYELGGYELATTPAGPGAGEALAAAALELAQTVREGRSPGRLELGM